MALFARWRAERDLERRAAVYVQTLLAEPGGPEVAWLAQVATRGDLDHARWELRYARRALGLLAAQRDALDDRTAASVARALSGSFARDPNIASGMVETAERQFNARLSAYHDGLSAKGGPPTTIRMGQTLLAFAGGSFRGDDAAVVRAGEILDGLLAHANESLRASFGTAALPEHVPPSALTSR